MSGAFGGPVSCLPSQCAAAIFGLALAVALGVTCCGPAEPDAGVAIGETLPAFELPRLGGGSVSTGELAGERPVILTFWATWCRPCIRELPALRELHASGDVRVVSINVDAESYEADVHEFVARHEIGYEVLRAELSMVPRYGSNSIPYTLVLDGDLTVRALHRSLVTRSTLETELRRLKDETAR